MTRIMSENSRTCTDITTIEVEAPVQVSLVRFGFYIKEKSYLPTVAISLSVNSDFPQWGQ